MGDQLWAFAWTYEGPYTGSKPSEKPFICSSTLHDTREAAWDDILKSWFTPTNGTIEYFNRRTMTAISRDAAIKFLKRRGGRVMKVKVTLIGDFQT